MAEGFFWGNDPNVNQQLRQRIALQLMSQRKGFPKTIGEGLTAVGDTIGDLGIMRRLEQGDLAQQDAAKAAAAGLTGGDQRSDVQDAPVRTAYADPGDMQDKPPVVPQLPVATANLTPEEQTAGVQGGGFNPLDAAAPARPAGYQPAPAYLQPALARLVRDPERQAYLGQLASREARSATEVSPTGAAGPFQFTRGTGRQYGLMGPGGDQRTNIDASILAANRFTDDNVATLTAKLGRPPTPGEMALAHQQGAVTAARMLTGAGNAPANNLAVNNVNPGASPQAAAARIMGYYGMPGQPSTNPRDAIAAAQLAQRQAGPQPNPIQPGAGPSAALPFSGSPTAPGDLPPEITTGASAIRSAPPLPSQIQAAPPPVQVAQAGQQPTPTPGYVMPEPGALAPPPTVSLSPLGQKALAIIQASPNNDYIAKGPVGQTLQNELARQKLQQDQVNEEYKAKLIQNREMAMERQKQLADQAKRIADVARTQQEIQVGRMVDPNEKQFVLGSDGVARPLKVEGVDPNAEPRPKLTEYQGNSVKYARQMLEADRNLDPKALQDRLSAVGSSLPLVGSAAQSAAYRNAQNAANRFVLGKLRSESGATINPEEFRREYNSLIPLANDDAKTLEAKARARQIAIEGMSSAAGPGKDIISFHERRGAEARIGKALEDVAAGRPGTVDTEEEAHKLPVGSKFRLRDGRTGTVR